MTMGYFLRVGDKTTCGGEILSGDPTFTWNGVPTARDGDAVSCGKHSGRYQICGGIQDIWDEGKMLAGTLDSVSSCPCRATFINSIFDSYEKKTTATAFTTAPWAASPSVAAAAPPAPPPGVKPPIPVFAKSCQRGKGCTDAGTANEPHYHFGVMGFYQAIPRFTPENKPVVPHAQAAKGKSPPPTPKQKDQRPWYKRLFTPQPLTATPALAVTRVAALEQAGIQGMRPIAGTFATVGRWMVSSSPVGAAVMGMMPGSLNSNETELLQRLKLENLARNYSSAPTRVRFRWVDGGEGRLKPEGYHTGPDSGQDQVPVRQMRYNSHSGNYEFWEDDAKTPTLLWTPNDPGFKAPPHTGNQDEPQIPLTISVLPIADKAAVSHTELPLPEENGFRDYIIILPLPDIPPLYIYLSKQSVKPLEVGKYDDLAGRSLKDGLDIDHIPSQGALKNYLQDKYPNISPKKLKKILANGVAIAIPQKIHQRYSETYGGKNTAVKKSKDASDLKAAVTSNFEAQRIGLREAGFSDEQLNQAHQDLHHYNRKQGWYK